MSANKPKTSRLGPPPKKDEDLTNLVSQAFHKDWPEDRPAPQTPPAPKPKSGELSDSARLAGYIAPKPDLVKDLPSPINPETPEEMAARLGVRRTRKLNLDELKELSSNSYKIAPEDIADTRKKAERVISIRVPDGVFIDIKKAAVEMGLTMADYITYIHLKAQNKDSQDA